MTQAQALDILRTGANVFLTGNPGSGKTHTVNEYVAWLRSYGVEPAITASTGIAATHIKGMTVHSWSGIGIRDRLTASDLDAISSKEHVARRLQKAGVLIIDEISMLSGNVLDMLDEVLREVRGSERAFGGMQVVLVGDFFQLPPVSGRGQEAVFAFQSQAWRSLNPIVCYLTEQHRHEDEQFRTLLDEIRSGEIDQSGISTLLAREADEVDSDIPRLHTHNADVDRENDAKLTALSGNPQVFAMKGAGSPVVIEALKRGCLSPETLVLKEGAVVMATKNNPAAGYVNGSLGRIVAFERGTRTPVVEFLDGATRTMEPVDWELMENGKVRGKITQIPLRLAWAITIHKSQGQSMDTAAIDLSRAFEYGQGYVALSRVRTLAGVHLLGWSEHALAIHPEVRDRDSEFRSASGEAVGVFASLEESGEREVMQKRFLKSLGGSERPMAAGERQVKKTTFDETYELIERGSTLKDAALARNLTVGTIIEHVERLSQDGRLDAEMVRELVPDALQKALPKIFEAFDKKGSSKLGPVYAALHGKYSYEELKLARAIYALPS